MNDFLELYGMVIKVQPVGEYDKRITLLTKERGKISAFARGARHQGNAMMGATRTFATGLFRLREGKDSYNCYSAQIDNYFEPLYKDLESTCLGTYFLELADYYSREMLSDPQLLKLLYLALTAISKESIPNELVRRVFELRVMAINGEYDTEPPMLITENGPSKPCDTTYYTWDFIVKTPLEKLFTFTLTPEILSELSECVDKCLHKYVDKEMKSLSML